MYCSKCGKQIDDQVLFCKFCGAPTGNKNDAGVPDEKPKKSRKGLVLGIVFGTLFLVLAGSVTAAFATGFAQKTVKTIQAEKYVKNKEYKKAIESYEALLKLDDTDEKVYLALAELYLNRDEPKEAYDVLKKGLKKIRRPSEQLNEMYDDVLAILEDARDDSYALNERHDKEDDNSIQEDNPIQDSEGRETPVNTDDMSPFDGLKQEAASRERVNVSLVSTDVSDFPLVRLYLDVTDSNGEQIELTTPQGAIREAVSGGQFIEREVRRIEKLEGNEGLSIELIADKSASMDWRMDQVKSIMSEFVYSLDYNSGDQAELIAFDSYVMYMCTKTNNADLLNNGIYNMVPTGNTALYDALYEGVINAGYQPGARCVIAFTDGGDNMSVHTYQEIIDLAQQNAVAIYIIGTDKYTESILQNISLSSNGYYWYIDDLADMGEIFDEIYAEQKDLYCFEYISDESTQQYSSRTVDFIIGDSSVTADVTTSFTPVETLKVQEHTSRYEIIPADISWTEANAECIARGGHLATISSEEEMNQLIALAEDSGLRFLWIGGYTSVYGSQTFGHWVTGEPFSYTAWYEGEPSRNDMDGTPEMYIMMWKIKKEWSWNDQRNDPVSELDYFVGDIGFICEYEE